MQGPAAIAAHDKGGTPVLYTILIVLLIIAVALFIFRRVR